MSNKITIDINNKDTNYWSDISEKYVLNENIIRDNINKINWDYVSNNQKLSEGFIREFANKVNWYNISAYQKLSEKFIREFSDKVNWYYISQQQKLSEKFIREFSHKIDWYCIAVYQKLSQEFIRECFGEVVRFDIGKYQKLSPEFIKEHHLKIPNTCWLYKDKEYKRRYFKRYTSYEIIGDKVIAYKSCRSDGYSVYNFQYYYKAGKEYKCHADYNIDNNNSFGLSAWEREKAFNHHSTGKLFKVEIDLEDIAAIIHDGNKIRASKIKILKEIKI
jgi:hypothetical protein